MARYARLTRTAMIEVAEQDFVKNARAKGISERQVSRRHILRNALIPLITFAGLQASILVGGNVLVENVFSWPGVGTLAVAAAVRGAPARRGVAAGVGSSRAGRVAVAAVPWMEGAIVGKALYAGACALPEALAAVRG